jgi:sec-independent protein translocase protein TatA
MPHFGAGELIILLLIVLVLFGGGRISRLGGEMGSAIREFRKGIDEETDRNHIK